MPPIIHDNFDPLNVLLEDSNLIEASAGTGKTYSIALLALRLIVEKDYRVDEILMVTFTKDAAAEMELRVRAFMRDALQAALGNPRNVNPDIISIINRVQDKEKVMARLKAELAQFDKAAIFTIHGFCSRILSEYAFQTGQLFRAAAMEPETYQQYLEDAFNQAWREKVTTLSERVLALFEKNKHKRNELWELVKGHLAGKTLFVPAGKQNSLQRLQLTIIDLEQQREALRIAVEASLDRWAAMADQLRGAVRQSLRTVFQAREADKIISRISKNPPAAYINEAVSTGVIDPALLNMATDIRNLEATLESTIDPAFTVLALECAQYIAQCITDLRLGEGQITFDDMITELHRTVCGNPLPSAESRSDLGTILRNRYKAVFIDEFQDTDRFQYEIFTTIFQHPDLPARHILFYIGDPKQSIYAFRKADLQTYFRAEQAVQHKHLMNQNFRSTTHYIDAMNEFFLPLPDYDVFNSAQMLYRPVSSPAGFEKSGGLYYNQNVLSPVRIVGCADNDQIFYGVVDLVAKLLFDPNFLIVKGDQPGRRIGAGQIGVLVRSGYEGRLLKKLFAAKNIPAVSVTDTKVFESEEAQELQHILKAAVEVSRGSIHKALLTKIAGFTLSQILLLDEDQLSLKFREYQEQWKGKGVYVFLREFLNDVQAIQRQATGAMPNADRRLSNMFQLMEMLHQAEQDKKYNPGELMNWLKKGISGKFSSKDQYLQRIESDDQAVKIVTIHKSKGLEYDLVIAPFLDIKLREKAKTVQFHHEDVYYTADKDLLDDNLQSLAKVQEEQENMRLLYVAVTRARYHAYFFTYADAGESSLQRLLKPLIESTEQRLHVRLIARDAMDEAFMNSVSLETDPPELIPATEESIPSSEIPSFEFDRIPKVDVSDKYWERTSYSSLNPKHIYYPRAATELSAEDYDQFVFKHIKKGAQSGNLLHYLFEKIDFTNDKYWSRTIHSALGRYPGTGIKTEHENQLKDFLNTVLATPLKDETTAFSLSQVSLDRRLNELEFDLPLSNIHLSDFPEQLEERIPFRIHRDKNLTGILNGKIDLFFEHSGKYYLLDWKSNHLGNRPEDYHAEALADAMEENNYYLQYYLYSLALYRYLRLRIPGFDYEKQFGGVYYLFVRGIRTDKDYGIYYHKPVQDDLVKLEEMMLAQTFQMV